MGYGASSGISFEEYMRKKKEEEEKNNLGTKAENSTTTKKIGGASSGISFEDYMYETKVGSKVTVDSVKKWFSDADSTINSLNDYYTQNQGKYNANYGSEYMAKIRELNDSYDTISAFVNHNKDGFEDYDSISNALSQYKSYLSEAYMHTVRQRKYYGQWENEDAYNSDVAAQKEYEELSTLDLDALKKDVDYYQTQVDNVKNLERMIGQLDGEISTYKYAANFSADARAKLAELENRKAVWEQKLKEAKAEGYDKALSDLTAKYNRAKHIQNGIQLTNDALDADDFEEKSGYVSTKKDDFWSRLTGNEYDKTYEYINDVDGMRSEIEHERDVYQSDNDWDDGESTWEEKGYDLLTDEEVAIYNYYYSTEGKEKAEEYLDSIQETLYNRRANEMFAKMEDKPFLEYIFGVEAGLDQFASGMANAFNFKDDYIPVNAIQQASGMVREDLADKGFKVLESSIGQIGYDAITTTANMLPSILTSTAVNFVVPGSGAVVGAGMMGTSAAGSAYQEMLNLGYDKGQARTYSTLVGISEAGLQYALGGLSKLGGKVTNSVISKAISGIDNGLARFAIDFGGKLASEGIEEGLQEVINPLLKNAIFYTDEDVDWSQVAYSTLLGSLSAFGLEGIGTTASHIKYNSAVKAEGNRIVNNGGVDSLVALANEMAGVSDIEVADNLSARVGKANGKNGVNTKAVGKLSFAVNDARVQQNKADIVEALEGKGISSKKAQKYADILFEMNEDYFAGEKSTFELGTDAQWEKITGDSDAYSVLRGVVTDMDSSVNARNSKYALARNGVKVNEDGTMSLTEERSARMEQTALKDNYAKQSEDISSAVADDGKTKVISTDTEVTVKGIDHIEIKQNDDGETERVGYVRVADADGNESVVKVTDVAFGSRKDAVLYETFVAMDIDPVYFDAFVKNFNEADFDTSIGEAAIQYANGFRNAFRYGWANLEAELSGDVYASKLTDTVRNTAFTLGRDAVTSKIEAKQKALDTAVEERKASGKGKVRVQGKLHMEGVKTKKRTALQNAGVGLAKRLTSLGVDVYLYESHQNAKGEWVDDRGELADNGFYRASDGSIHIDINAGVNGQGIMVFTLAHELTHFMRDKSPREFKVFADLLIKWYGEKGVSVNELIEQRMAEENLSWDEAYEEVIARSCESFLTDSNIADRILELQQTDKKTWEVIRDKVLAFLNWMKSLFKNVDLESAEGQYLRKHKTDIDHLYDAFYNTLADAVETHQWAGSIAEAKTTAETLATAGITVDADTGSAVMNSVRYAPKTQAEIDKVAKALSESMGVSIEKAKAWVKSETSLSSIILDPSNAMFLDYEADDRYEAIKKNAEYPQGTVDFSNLCKKRREFTALLDKLQKEHPNRIITAEEMEKIRQVLIEENVEVACGLCYVEERRQLLGEIAQGFIDGYKNGTLKANIAKELDAKDTYVPTIYDLITYDGYRALTTEHPSVAKAFQKFNNARGMQAGRLIEGIAEYKRDILNWSQKKVDFVNSVGGLRVFSFSDFEATHLIDLVQVIQDCAVKGVMIQAYTKVPAFANAVKDTNMKVNRSLIAKGTGIKYENGRMVLDLDPVEGIDINDKDFFDSTNSESVGNVLVGMSNEQIRLAMKTPFVDYIIPFHTGLKGDILRAKKIDHWDNYKNFQTDKEFHPEKVTYKKDGTIKNDGWSVAENQINVYVDVIQAAEAEGKPIKNKVDFVNKFLAVAKEKGLKPRFWNFLDVDANGEYTYTEGYHKFLVDFKLFDQQGNILPQKPVVPVFDDGLNARILNEYVAGKKAPVSRDAVYDRLEREVIKRSSRNTHSMRDNSTEKVYNGENITKEGLIRGESRQETREAFLRRAVQDVLQVTTRGKTAYGYRRSLPSDVKERSRQTERELKRLGVPSVIYDRLEVNRDGITSVRKSEATTIRGDAVYINNAVLLNAKEVAGHEAYHFWDSSDERSFYTEVLTDNIDFSSKQFASFISKIGDGYSLDDAEIGSKQWEELMEEVCAYISGFIHSGNNVDLVMPFIRDFAEVKAAWNAFANSHSQNTKKSSKDIRYSKRQKAPTFYSYMGVVVDGVKQEKLGAASVINMLKGKGVKDEEIKWSGIETWLEGKKSVTKAELQEFIAGSQLQIGEEMSGINQEAYDELEAMWKKHTGVSLSETFSDDFDYPLTPDNLADEFDNMAKEGYDVPFIEDQLRMIELAKQAGNDGRWSQYKLAGGRKYREIVFTMPNSTYSNNAMRGHWGQDAEGVLAHARVQDFVDADGKKMLFIEEIQSDWHNEGARVGYSTTEYEDAVATYDKLAEEYHKVDRAFHKYVRSSEFNTDSESVRKKKFDWLRSKVDVAEKRMRDAEGRVNALKEKGMGDTPDAPFRNTYHEFVLKRLIRMAAEEGYDSIGWTTAQIQSDRWSEDYAEGYRIEYDQDIPKFLRKYGKRWGATVSHTALNNKSNRDTYTDNDGKQYKSIREWYDSVMDSYADKDTSIWMDYLAGLTKVIQVDNTMNIQLKRTGEILDEALHITTEPDTVWSMPITDSMKDSVLYEGQVMYSRRGTGMSNRSLLANSLESATQNDSEARRLEEYKAKIDLINAEEQKLHKTRERIAELSFASGPKDTVAIKNLQDTATRIANRINTYDKQLLNLEATAPLKAVLEREKAMARKREKQKANEALAKYREKSAETLREVMNRNTESRKRNVESRKRTVVRNKIKRVVTDLNGLLNRGTKERNVKTDMQETVGTALKLANVLFNDEITNEDIVLMGSTMATEEEQKLLDQYADLVKKRDSAPADEAMRYINKMSDLNRKLADLFKRERARLNQARVSEAVDELAKAYADLKVSDKDYVSVYYSEEAHQRLQNLSKELGGTIMKDMSLAQLEEVYEAYKMIRHIVRESNSLFRMGKTQDLAKTVIAVQEQILALYKEREKDPRAFAKKFGDILKGFAWNEMKPLTAFETLGAEAFTELFWDAIKAEGDWARMMEEANVFLDEQRKKYGYKSWNMDTAHEFTLPDGKVFRLTLQDMMSIYAYSKREQAQEHMTVGGFQFDKNNAYKDKMGKKRVRLGDLYVTDWSTIIKVIGELTDEQRGYVDAVQQYLTDMGKRGNEVSEILYGIGIFNETAYFPLMSAKDYRSSVEEALNATPTQVSLKNTGMTKQTVPHASNPIILQGFDDVVIGHIDKMAKYCTHVLAIENLRRVFDSVSADDNGGYVSTKAVIEKVFGEGAKKYIDKYITDLNGGVFVEGAKSPTMAMFSKFKGTAVGASLSVVIQQPFAVIRAMDAIAPKHFVGRVSKAETKRLYDEIRRYAPVAIIKEMGGFDVGSSRTAREYLGVRTDKGLERAVDEVNNVAMWGAGWADRVGWSTIWNAVKREVASEGKFTPGTEEFLEACGERFTEVIVRTQVYDSVNSRSGFMRSKSDLDKFMTSFMGEPTTVVNQAYLAMLNVSRANGKQEKAKAGRKLGRTMAVLLTSTLLTTLAKSLIYGMRDDEDDEAFFERWANRFADSLKSDINPMNLFPYARDIVSILEGWDVERPDMTLIANFITSAKRLLDDGATVDEAVTLFGDTANLFGIPAKNLIRDAKAIVNLFGDIFDDVKPTDIGGAFVQGWTGKDKAKTDALYDAIVNGDTGKVEAIKKGYKDDKAVESAIRKGLRDNDPRIKEAAKARYEGDVAEYMRLVREIKAEGHFSQDTIVSAINTEISQLKPDKESTSSSPALVTASDYYNAIVNGQSSTAESIKKHLVSKKIAEGYTEEDAEESVVSGLIGQVGNAYTDGELSRSSAESILSRYCDKEDNDIYWTLDKWDYARQNGSTEGYSKYGEFYTAVESGRNLKATIKRYTDHGVEAKTLASQITTYFKPLYREMSNAERANIKGYLLNAYAQLGYNRVDKSKDIDRWLKD